MPDAVAELIIALAREKQVPTLQLLADIIRATLEREEPDEDQPENL